MRGIGAIDQVKLEGQTRVLIGSLKSKPGEAMVLGWSRMLWQVFIADEHTAKRRE